MFEIKDSKEYIKSVLKDDSSLKEDKKVNNKKVEINHLKLLNTFNKLISVCPMDETSRKVLLLRLNNVGMTCGQVAIMMGILEDDVIRYEADGKNRVSEFLNKSCIQENINKYNIDDIAKRELKRITKNKLNVVSDRKGPAVDASNLV